MINKPAEEITIKDIENLIEYKVAECRTIEYKRELNIDTDSDKKEFLADISSMANASGGFIFFGIEECGGEEKGIPDKACGFPVKDKVALKLRIEEIVRNSIDPRIPGMRIEFVDLSDDSAILIVQIPQSWNSPHMVTYKSRKSIGFFSRNSAGKYPLDVTEIRSAFSLSQELPERIRDFRADRLAKIVAGETPMPVADGPRVVLHILPVSAFTGGIHFNINEISDKSNLIMPIGASQASKNINFDGCLINTLTRYRSDYVQIFRTCAIEEVTGYFFLDPEKDIVMGALEEEIIQATGKYLDILESLNVSLPVLICLSMIGVKFYKIELQNWSKQLIDEPITIDRDTLIIPEIIIESYDVDVPVALKPIFDVVWNASGHACSPNYKDGVWQVR